MFQTPEAARAPAQVSSELLFFEGSSEHTDRWCWCVKAAVWGHECGPTGAVVFQLVFPEDVKLTEKEVRSCTSLTCCSLLLCSLGVSGLLLAEEQHLLPVLPRLLLR